MQNKCYAVLDTNVLVSALLGALRNPDHGRPVNPLKIPLKRYSFTY